MLVFFNRVPYMQISDMIPGVNIIWDPSRSFKGQSTLRKFLGSKEHLDWLNIDLNVAEIITVQNYKHTQKPMLMEVHMYSVKAKSQQVIYESKI